MSDYPAVFRNAKGDRLVVPNARSCPIGFYRDPDAQVEEEAPPQPATSRKVELKREYSYAEMREKVTEAAAEPVEGITVIVDNDEDEADALDAIKGFSQ